jgi:hypothetical protein
MTLKHGSHIGTVHRWIQRRFNNGSTVTWGSNDVLAGTGLTVIAMEELAQEIKEALFYEYNIKDKDHVYKYTVCVDKDAPAFQDADTMQEIWNCLFVGGGKVHIYKRAQDGSLGELVFKGTIQNARDWATKEDTMCKDPDEIMDDEEGCITEDDAEERAREEDRAEREANYYEEERIRDEAP